MSAIPTAFDPLGVLGGGGYTFGSALRFSGVQAIDTGVIPDDSLTWLVEMQGESTTPTQRWGANNNALPYYYYNVGSVTTNRTYAHFYNGEYVYPTAPYIPTSARVTVVVHASDATFTPYETGVSQVVAYSPRNYPTWSLAVGASKVASGSFMNSFTGLAYACKAWKNNVLIQDLVPALDPTGRPCMFDRVTSQPFYAQPLSPTSTDFVEPIFVP